MRILLQGSLGVYGVESFVQSLAYYLRQINVEVAISSPFGRFLLRPGQLRTHGAYQDRASKTDRKTHDLIHLNYAFASLPLLLRTLKTPFLYTVHGVPRPYLEPQLRYKIGYTLEDKSLRFVASRASKVVAISEYVRGLLRDLYGVNSEVIRNGVDTGLFRPISLKDRVLMRSALAVPPTEKSILFVGKLYPYKDPMTLVHSISHITSRLPNAVFTIVGEGPLKSAIISEASRMGLRRSIRLMPYLKRSELVARIQIADVFVSTAPAEMLGFSVMEAMSCGIPVVAANSGGPVEVLGEAGTFFRPTDEVDLAEKILRILRDEYSDQAKGWAGRQIILRDYGWEQVAMRYADVYRRMIQ